MKKYGIWKSVSSIVHLLQTLQMNQKCYTLTVTIAVFERNNRQRSDRTGDGTQVQAAAVDSQDWEY